MAITSSAVVPSNSLEEFRIEFNNLVTDVDALEDISIVSATTTVQGKAELATTAETVTGTDTARVITPAGLHGALAGLTDTTIVAADSIIFADANDSNALKEDTVQGILDLATVLSDTSPQLGGDLDCNGAQVQWSKGADVASGTALAVLTDGNYFDVTGTTTVTSINTTGVPDTTVNSSADELDFNEYVYTAGVTDDGIGTPLDEFISFQIKIVMQGTNCATPPRLREFRAIALVT